MNGHRILPSLVVASVVALSLSSCVLLGPVLGEASQHGPVNDRPVVDGPDGWEEFLSCEAGPRDDFVWVDGLPYEEMEASGVDPDCGDTWIESDGDHYMNVTDYSISEEQLDALEVALVAAGWEKKFDDFAPVSSPTSKLGYAGARDFYRDDDTRLFAVEIYHDPGSPISYTAYLDYHSPETRALSGS